jgi:cell division protein FtsB
MTIEMREIEPDKSRPPMIWVLIILAAAILIFGDLNSRMAETRRLERDAYALQTEVVVMKTENAVLATQVAGATSEASIQEWAHEQGGMALPGEVLVVPVAPEGEQSGVEPTPAPSFEPPSNWEVWWALLFGG